MYNHAPKNYVCPICLGVKGAETDETMIRNSDIVYRDELVMAFVSSFFIADNLGHLVIVPIEHFENLYEIPESVGNRIFVVSKKIAEAMKTAYKCPGVMTMQNNEPASDQHAFHYHLHLFPRYEGDRLHERMNAEKKRTTAKERLPFAERMRQILNL